MTSQRLVNICVTVTRTDWLLQQSTPTEMSFWSQSQLYTTAGVSNNVCITIIIISMC